jgi:hypothetical protein
MGARTKLNEIHALIAAVVAAVAGLASGSWLVFGICLAILIAIKMHSGAIRASRRKP